jgi:hypothetical protein
MPPRETKQAKLDPVAHEALGELQIALASQRLPRTIDLTDILSALVLYTPVPQLAGMLAEYWRYTEERLNAEAELGADAEAAPAEPDSD